MKRVLFTALLSASIIFSSCGNIFGVSPMDRVLRAIVQIQLPEGESTGICTGFIVDAARGWALTAKHCVPTDPKAEILVNGEASAVIKTSDTLAIVRTNIMTTPPLEIRQKDLQLGEAVKSFGFGRGKMVVFGRGVAAILDGKDIALDGPLLEGMSGGPVVDADGKVVGINQAVYFGQVGIACGQEEIRDFLAKK